MADQNNDIEAPEPWRLSGMRLRIFMVLLGLAVPLSIASALTQHTPLVLASGSLSLMAVLASGALFDKADILR